MIPKERCESCGRYKLYNTGGGLICTNLNCRYGISPEQDLAEVDALRKNDNPDKCIFCFSTLDEKGECFRCLRDWAISQSG